MVDHSQSLSHSARQWSNLGVYVYVLYIKKTTRYLIVHTFGKC